MGIADDWLVCVSNQWGRCMEVYGEDPSAIAALGHAYVQGLQHGDVGAPSTDILLIASSPKQYAGSYSDAHLPAVLVS